MTTLQDVHGVGAGLATVLERNGYGSVQALAAADPEALAAIRGLGARRAPAIVAAAQRLLAALDPPEESPQGLDEGPAAETPPKKKDKRPKKKDKAAKPGKKKAKPDQEPPKKPKKKKKKKKGKAD